MEGGPTPHRCSLSMAKGTRILYSLVARAFSDSQARHNYLSIGGIAFALLIFVWFKCTQVLYGQSPSNRSCPQFLANCTESVIAYPPHGLQLETHRGFPPHPLTVSRRFVPLTSLQDFFINEGLRRWDVRFYLVAMSKSSKGRYSLEVAYEASFIATSIFSSVRSSRHQNILPHFPVLLEVYRGVHDALFEQPDQDSA
jgi:hypothetical protein